jgi:hypothetical protein
MCSTSSNKFSLVIDHSVGLHINICLSVLMSSVLR